MRLRETGSIHLDAPRERVYEVLAQRLAREPGVRASHDRLESTRRDGVSTFILKEDARGTRVIHARTGRAALSLRPREGLRQEVEAELVRLQRLVDAVGRAP